MPLRLEITIPPPVALDLDPRKVRAVLRSATAGEPRDEYFYLERSFYIVGAAEPCCVM
jgi:hypothetical protein